MTRRVLVADPLCPPELVRDVFGTLGVEVEAVEPPPAGPDVVGLVIAHDVRLAADDLARLPTLRVVATTSIGYDHIELEAALERGIWVCNVPDYCVEEVADTTIALVAALLRGVVALDRSVRSGEWSHTAAGPLRRIGGARLGVVGFGRIGRAVAARGRALRMDVLAHDPFVPVDEIGAAGARAVSLDELLAESDCVTLHAPLSGETETLIGADELGRIRPGAYLVNTARGLLVDVDALQEALADGRLAGAALDVLPDEPPTGVAPAPRGPTLIVTPHAAWYSEEAEQRASRSAALAVRAVLEGRRPENAVVAPGEAA